jgi:hypothetical protein
MNYLDQSTTDREEARRAFALDKAIGAGLTSPDHVVAAATKFESFLKGEEGGADASAS